MAQQTVKFGGGTAGGAGATGEWQSTSIGFYPESASKLPTGFYPEYASKLPTTPTVGVANVSTQPLSAPNPSLSTSGKTEFEEFLAANPTQGAQVPTPSKPVESPIKTSEIAEQEATGLKASIQQLQETPSIADQYDPTKLTDVGKQKEDLLNQRRTELEQRREGAKSQIEADFARRQREVEQAQTKAAGSQASKIARMGGYLGETGSGEAYMQNLDLRHRQEMTDLVSAKAAALMAAENAFNDSDFALAQQKLDIVTETEKEIYNREQNYQEQKSKARDQQMKEAQFEFDMEKSFADITGMFRGEPTYEAVQQDLKNALQIANLTGEFMGAQTLEAKKQFLDMAIDESSFDLETQKFNWEQQQDQIANDFKAQEIDLDYSRLDLDKMKSEAETMGLKPPTSIQLAAFGYYTRANDAEEKIQALEPVIANMGLFGQINLRFAPNVIQNPDYQKFNQAKRQFVEAYLRKDSGAAIAQSEYENADRTYFPQPGDSSEVLEAKRQARQSILNSLKAQSGNAIKVYTGDITAGSDDPIDAFIQENPDKLETIEQMINEGIDPNDIINALTGG